MNLPGILNQALKGVKSAIIPSLLYVTRYEPVILLDVDNLLNRKGLGWNKLTTSALITSSIMQVLNNSIFSRDLYSDKTRSGMDMMQGIITSSLIASTIPWVYMFRINPQTVKFNYNKLQTSTSYGYGMYDLEYYGDQLVSMDFSGTTGNLTAPWPLPDIGMNDPRLSVPYIKLKEFEHFYKNISQKFFIVLFLNAYLCHIENFSYSIDANNPRQILYDFSLKVNPYFTFNILTGDVKDCFKYGRTYWDENINYKDTLQSYISSDMKSYIPRTDFGSKARSV